LAYVYAAHCTQTKEGTVVSAISGENKPAVSGVSGHSATVQVSVQTTSAG